MDQVLVTVYGCTDVGMQRSGNEDAFMVADLTTGDLGVSSGDGTHTIGERGSLLMVSDGMGGEAAGEVASEMAVSTIRQALMNSSGGLSAADRLEGAVKTANELIWNHAQQNPEYSRMGATVTAVLAQGPSAYIAQVGDSRAYLIRGQRIKQLTKDQSLAQLLVDSGVIEADQVATFPQKNVIMQALGAQVTVNVAITSIELRASDCLLLCSDGLSNKVSPEEMLSAVHDCSQISEACTRLVALANERGGEDNITVVISRFEGEALQADGSIPTITDSFGVVTEEYASKEAADIVERFKNTAPMGGMAGAIAATSPDSLPPIPITEPLASVEQTSVTGPSFGEHASAPETPVMATTAFERLSAEDGAPRSTPGLTVIGDSAEEDAARSPVASWMLLVAVVATVVALAVGFYLYYPS
ncbi:MAG TPA: Stp1/IreP family PP2C-type Ser/Thr phosphatase [Blastocatellia bacterium]|nr:Stp1/IreP family PP2C-type Ser/Thr phosphatase [Blastocatellia bacterium]